MTDQQADNPDTVVDIDQSKVPAKQEKMPVEKKASPSHVFGEMRHSPEQIKDLFRNGTYPYKTRIRKAVYEQHKEELQSTWPVSHFLARTSPSCLIWLDTIVSY